MSSFVYIIGTYITLANSDKQKFIVLGWYDTMEEAKQIIDDLAKTVIHNSYKNLSLYKLDPDASHVYTFEKHDLQPVYDEQQQNEPEEPVVEPEEPEPVEP